VPAAERYRLVTEQIVHAEALGLDSAWVAQHHFHADEGGLPSPLVFLASVAARTHRIRLGTGIVTLPLESPVRVAEDAAVLDLISGGRLEFGVGTGGTPSSFMAFGQSSEQRAAVFASHLALLRDAWAGRPLPGGDRLYPAPSASLLGRIWQASFSAAGGARAGAAGDGLMLSRTQPRPADAPRASLAELQLPIVEAYLAALPAGHIPRITGSRSVFIADDRALARRLADEGLRRALARSTDPTKPGPHATLDELIARQDVHVGTPDEVIASLRADRTLAHVTDLVCQVHSVDPPHRHILRSIELLATKVGPALGWAGSAGVRHSLSPPTQAFA
jgi:putative FMN-dependent luciferase-like monooxygenase